VIEPALALVETNSIAAGILAGDAMVKKAVVQLLEARSICPGKYMILIGGEVGPVREAYDAAVCIVAADAAVKAADVQLLEIRLANGLGGKSFVLLEGIVADVEAAVAAGVALVKEEGLLIRKVVIPQLHPQMRGKIL